MEIVRAGGGRIGIDGGEMQKREKRRIDGNDNEDRFLIASHVHGHHLSIASSLSSFIYALAQASSETQTEEGFVLLLEEGDIFLPSFPPSIMIPWKTPTSQLEQATIVGAVTPMDCLKCHCKMASEPEAAAVLHRYVRSPPVCQTFDI
jgi:hypothetical protein